MAEFGSGIALNQSPDDPDEYPWDLIIDNSGDIAATFGPDELEKDLAFHTALRLDVERSQVNNPNTRQRIKVIVRDEMLNDPRVMRVFNVDVSESNDADNTVDISVRAQASDEEQQLVFSI